jgi:hypothetical protein
MAVASGGCADGSGNWLPLPTSDPNLAGFVPICPSDPLWPAAVALNRCRRAVGELTPEEQYAEEAWKKATPYIIGSILAGAAVTALLFWAVLRTER